MPFFKPHPVCSHAHSTSIPSLHGPTHCALPHMVSTSIATHIPRIPHSIPILSQGPLLHIPPNTSRASCVCHQVRPLLSYMNSTLFLHPLYFPLRLLQPEYTHTRHPPIVHTSPTYSTFPQAPTRTAQGNGANSRSTPSASLT